jgi:hypothetical protein
MKDYIYRMMDERKELVEKWDKLLGFFNKNRRNLDDTERYLLEKQDKLMSQYINILDARISHATLKEQLKEDEK